MTIGSESWKVQYDGTGAQTSFTVTFQYAAKDDVVVIHTDADGNDTTWVRGTQYTLTDPGTSGTLTVSTSPTDFTPAADERLTIYRDVGLTQQHYDKDHGTALSGPEIEESFDHVTFQLHRMQEQLNRGVLRKQNTETSGPLDLPEPEADGFLAWNTEADALENKQPADAADASFPVSSTDNAIARFDGTSGNSLQGSGVTIDDSDNVSGAGIDLANNTLTGSTTEFDTALQSDTFVFTSEVGSVVQAWSARLDDVAGLTPSNGNFIVGDGSNWVAESGNTARTSLGLGTGDSPQFSGLNVNGGGADVTVTANTGDTGFTARFEATETGGNNSAFFQYEAGGNNLELGTIQGSPATDFVAVRVARGSTAVQIPGTIDLSNYIDFSEISTPANPAADTARLYAKDDSGTTKIYFRDSAGNETELGAGGGSDWTYAGEVTVQSGTAVTLASSIPSGVTEIEIMLRDISMDADNNDPKIEIGDSGGFETSGYTSIAEFNNTVRTDTTGFALEEGAGSDSNTSLHGTVVLRDYDGNGTNWHLNGNTMVSGGSDRVFSPAGWKNLSAVLTQVRIALGTGNFDTSTSSGVASVRYR